MRCKQISEKGAKILRCDRPCRPLFFAKLSETVQTAPKLENKREQFVGEMPSLLAQKDGVFVFPSENCSNHGLSGLEMDNI